MHGDMPRTSAVDYRDPVISTRSIVEHELAMAPNHIPTPLCCDWVDRDLGGLLDLVGNRLLDLRLTFQCTENTATEERILGVEVCEFCGLAVVVGGLPFLSQILKNSHRFVSINR